MFVHVSKNILSPVFPSDNQGHLSQEMDSSLKQILRPFLDIKDVGGSLKGYILKAERWNW